MAHHHCDISPKGAVLPMGTTTRKRAPQTCYKLWCNTTSIMKDLIWCNLVHQDHHIVSINLHHFVSTELTDWYWSHTMFPIKADSKKWIKSNPRINSNYHRSLLINKSISTINYQQSTFTNWNPNFLKTQQDMQNLQTSNHIICFDSSQVQNKSIVRLEQWDLQKLGSKTSSIDLVVLPFRSAVSVVIGWQQ